MTTPSHADVLAAIDKRHDYLTDRYMVRVGLCRNCGNILADDPQGHEPGCFVADLAAHCDDLRATAERHAPLPFRLGTDSGLRCPNHSALREPWPCPDVQQVIDRLTAWRALPAPQPNPGE